MFSCSRFVSLHKKKSNDDRVWGQTRDFGTELIAYLLRNLAFFMSSADFFQNQRFQKILFG